MVLFNFGPNVVVGLGLESVGVCSSEADGRRWEGGGSC